MGIPAFYRWLVEKYPLTVVDVIEEDPEVVNGVAVPIDASRPNPNGVEFDNLYLDMNNIIHPCFHPEDREAPTSYEEVYKAVFKYIDYIFSLVRPRKLLFLAIDGVAPRAKMNQQRARRFRAARDAAEAAEEEKRRTVTGKKIEDSAAPGEASKLDSNVITPGTEFMASLSAALRYYIQLRLNKDPGWRNIKVILSDANVPGEGEHKVAAYIRSQRNLPGFDPNTRHCLYGLDADLIMIALATHEAHFSILREDVRQNGRNAKDGRNAKFTGKGQRKRALNEESAIDFPKQRFQFLNIWILRDYLEHELKISCADMKIDLERLIDDFVFICLFVGNDFLPHVPSLEISEGAIDLLMTVYKKEFSRMGGYLTKTFKVDLERVEHFLQAVAVYETAIFERRSKVQKEKDRIYGPVLLKTHVTPTKTSNDVKDIQRSNGILDKATSNGTMPCIAVKDQIRLGERGWKERYYDEKFEAKTESDRDEFKSQAVMKYVEGICWIMHYYYQGVCSWQWFYPFHYAPFASDFLDLKHLDIQFMPGVPFKPFDQLMGVLPAASAHALPLSYRELMTDAASAIADFYPADFELDMNGKRFSWQAVCKLPFIEEPRLLAEIEKVEHTLTDDEEQRNTWAMDSLFVRNSHPLASKILSFHRSKKDHRKLHKAKVKRKLDPSVSSGMNGWMYISDKTGHSQAIYSPVVGMRAIRKNKSIFVYYKPPSNSKHISRLPKGVILPSKFITKKDIQKIQQLWHEANFGAVRFRRPVRNSVSGGDLSKKAHQLVSGHYTDKPTKQNNHIVENSGCRRDQPMKQEMNHWRDQTNSALGKRKRENSDQNKFSELRRKSKFKKKRN